MRKETIKKAQDLDNEFGRLEEMVRWLEIDGAINSDGHYSGSQLNTHIKSNFYLFPQEDRDEAVLAVRAALLPKYRRLLDEAQTALRDFKEET